MNAKNWRNKKGTSDDTCPCGNWRDHWINHSFNPLSPWPDTCSVEGCSGLNPIGGHLYDEIYDKSSVKIVPICTACNNKNELMSLKKEIPKIDAKESKFCKKRS